ncbi:MAG TPA: EGF domain-containing protein, partial [Polyangiales bacterium]
MGACVLWACGSPQKGADLSQVKFDAGPGQDASSSTVTPDGGAADSGHDSGVTHTAVSCSMLKCNKLATCSQAAGDATCACNAGYSGDGTQCADVNECTSTKLNDCAAQAACTNSAGGYSCKCKAGYTGSGKACTDIDECTSGATVCDANAGCTNAPGSASCKCNAGFTGDGKTCTDIDECGGTTPLLTCVVHAICANTPGSAHCECDHSMGYNGDGTTCSQDATCATNGQADCDAAATCTTINTDKFCVCPAGYTGDGGKTGGNAGCTNINECTNNTDNCDPHATCTDTPGSFSCSCLPGFSGSGTMCTDINECTSHTDNCKSHATCSNTVGGFNCNCPSGYTQDGSGGCNDINECAVANTCGPNAACMNTAGSYGCSCPSGFTGSDPASTGCTDINECSGTNPCSGGQMCTNTPGSYICGCNSPYVMNAGQCYCDLSGYWGMRQDVTTTWQPTKVLGTTTIINGGSYTTTLWELHKYSYDGTMLSNVQKKGCGSAGTPDLYSPFWKETYNSYVPSSVWDGLSSLNGANVPLTAAKVGSTFTSPKEAATLGIHLNNPLTDPWPTARAMVAAADRTDSDGDGVPGLTIWPHTPAEQTHASNQANLRYYSYIPVNWNPVGTVTARATCVATATRAIFHLTGKLDSCTSTSIQMSGTVINDETDVRVYDCRQASNSGASY